MLHILTTCNMTVNLLVTTSKATIALRPWVMHLKNKLTQADRNRIKQRQQEMNIKLVKRTIDKDGKMKVLLDYKYSHVP